MLSENLWAKIEQLARTLGLYVYDIDFVKEGGQDILRVSITKKAPFEKMNPTSQDSVSVQDCQNLSEMISPLIDVEGIDYGHYFLEVSSPGLERILKNARHYQFSLGERLSVKRVDKSVVEGILESFNPEKIEIDVEGEIQELALEDIKKAKVIFEF